MARGLVSQQSLINTANAIKFSTEDSAKMLPSEMPDNIKSIEGKIVTLPKGRVNFYDYDGELLYSYSPKEFIEEGLPDNPRHEGLIAQGWNWEYEEIATQIKEVGGDINVGQMYTTQSGATEIQIELDEDTLEPYLYFYCDTDASVTIDWGDNNLTNTDLEEEDYFNQQHIYTQPGIYIIKIIINQGTLGLDNPLLWNNIDHYSFYTNVIKRIYIGEKMALFTNCFKDCHFLNTIIISNYFTNILKLTENAFQNCYNLKAIVLPSHCVLFSNTNFKNNYNIQQIILPSSFKRNILGIQNCYNLKTITLPKQISLLISSANNYPFQNCYSLTKLYFSNQLSYIYTHTFQNCYNIIEYHFRGTTPPTLGANVFTGINQNCKIYVPYSTDHSVLNAYKTATNWSTWADYIVEEDAPIEYAMPTPIADRPELLVDVEEAEDGDEVNYSININIINEEDE